MNKKKLLCLVIALSGFIGCEVLFPRLAPIIVIAMILLILLFIVNRSAIKKILLQKKPFEIGGNIRNVDYLIIGDMIDPASVVPANKSFVQIKAPNRSLKASFEILKHTSSILDEDNGNVIIAVKNVESENPFSVFDIPFFYYLTIKKFGIEKMLRFSRFPLLVKPFLTIELMFNICKKNWNEARCPDEKILLFCLERNINLKYYE